MWAENQSLVSAAPAWFKGQTWRQDPTMFREMNCPGFSLGIREGAFISRETERAPWPLF